MRLLIPKKNWRQLEMEKETELYLINRIKHLEELNENLIGINCGKDVENNYKRGEEFCKLSAFDMLVERLNIQVHYKPVENKYFIQCGSYDYEADEQFAKLLREALNYGKQ